MKLICNVVGARPNFMKMAPVVLEARRRGLIQVTVHTGQHYDSQMSAIFFDALRLPKPDFDLGVGSGSHADQTARIMVGFERICLDTKPALVVVGGDVNSTLACALVAAKLTIPVAHVESGLRSFDRSMPEEINRILTDHLASLLFTTEPSGTQNLLGEGIAADQIHFVGNSMIDSLRSHIDQALADKPWERFDLEPGRYGLITLHRPANVDDSAVFSEIAGALIQISRDLPLLFPTHPRTLERMEQIGIDLGTVRVVEPLGYLEFLGLMAKARVVLTDSGGIQEETTALGVPCVTLRLNTERPITVQVGTNRLAGITTFSIVNAAREALSQANVSRTLPALWDGESGRRIVNIIEKALNEKGTHISQPTNRDEVGRLQGAFPGEEDCLE
ncbi:MAG TPA: UDP-N-acetylglucosamine 2-epimerase (non-hydrolyzing) [Candidatus Udaeobacter sp.]|nr:UDP-N-acetylglucosamine 2-epimerase (non-hydrolyzing) [Candidatus Udaeobacter sp.]